MRERDCVAIFGRIIGIVCWVGCRKRKMLSEEEEET